MSYQPYDYSAHPPQAAYQYPAGYSQADYNAYYGLPQLPEPPSQQPPVVHLHTIDTSVASQSMRRVLSSELRNVGFRGYQALALERLEDEVVSCKSFTDSVNYGQLKCQKSSSCFTDMRKSMQPFPIASRLRHMICSLLVRTAA